MTEKLDREALVEKAARAIYEVDPALVKGVRLAWDFEHFDAWVVREVWLRKARAALAVFEEAHTPTEEWEYGACYQADNGIEPRWYSMTYGGFAIREAAEKEVERYADTKIKLCRRRKAGPWEPVNGDTDE